MNSDVLERISQLVEKELEKMVSKNDMSPTELETVKKAVCLLKEIKEYESMDMRYSNNSYRRGRDSMTGQFVSRRNDHYNEPAEMMNVYGQNGVSNTGYSRHSIKDRMIDRLEGMMDEAHTDYERRTIEDFIHRLQSE